MCKSVDKGIVIERVRLLEKTGGKSGDWKRRGLMPIASPSSCFPIGLRAANVPMPASRSIRAELGDAFAIVDERVIADDAASCKPR